MCICMWCENVCGFCVCESVFVCVYTMNCDVCTCVYSSVYAWKHACKYVSDGANACMRICVYVYIYTCVCAFVCVYFTNI